MTTYRPAFVKQLDGSKYAGLNCTAAAGAMALDRHTLGRQTSTGAIIRNWTGDTVGGLRQQQVADAIKRAYGQTLDVETPIPVQDAFKRLVAGEGFMLAGQSSATRGTKWQASETFGGNHQWYVNERRKVGTVWEYLIYDPLGDGRRPGIVQSPFWLPQYMLYRFAERLNISATPDRTYVPLGPGRFYAVFTKDTEPHPLWAKGVPADIIAVDPPSMRTAAAIREAGHNFGTTIDVSDIAAALDRVGHDYGSTVNPSDLQWLLNWAAQH